MDQQISIEQLKNVIAFKDLPDDQLEWILAHSGYVEFEDSALIYKTGDSIDTMAILLEGKLDYYMNVKGKLVFYFSFENNDVTGGVTGLLPYSRLREVHGDIYAVGKIRMLKLHKRYFPELEKINPDLIQRLIGYMTERARIFANIQMQQEKVSALGKLAAGIAHELNNPASAIDRISDELSIRLKRNVELTGVLLNNNISPELIHKISGITHSKKTRRYTRERISPLERLRMEEDLNDWLDDNGFDNPGEISETFIDAGISPGDLDKIKGDTGDKAFQSIIHWLENLISSELIILDLEDASERITNLVGAIKSHVHMDRSGALHYTDIHKDIEDTLILLGYKIRDKNLQVKKAFCDDMTEVEAYSGELNQVWTNIIDNAIYAVQENGEIIIETLCDKKNITVKIIDNGAGIPKDIKTRIFDPFFTTKKVGEGTGIGLDIVKSVIDRHKGEIKVNSVPGKTEFIIIVPVTQQSLTEEIKDETSVHYNN